ncbi:MAG TPA: YicC family protein [Candidatus Kryptobacter bacterium]|nr:MAG: YicC family protein [Ignavibacteriae bacterium 37-53-5]HQT91689.1 YicC family protein [Candidatus Kryptobacter bacterium]
MIQSMTGFGKGQARVRECTASVEIRSVNSRYLEMNVKLPQTLSSHEMEVREMIRQKVGRGKLSITVSTDNSPAEQEISVDAESVKQVIALLKTLKKSAKITSPIRLEHLLSFRDLFKSGSLESPDGDEWEAVEAAVEAALEQLRQARTAEGQSLKKDLEMRISKLGSALTEIESLSKSRTEDEKSRLRQKVSEVMNGKEVDPARLELEIVLLADRLDITEEVVRFRTHNQLFTKLIEGDESNGRRLNFLLQEMNREVNTMGSKAFDADMSHLVVEIKEELEKVREQVQNLE